MLSVHSCIQCCEISTKQGSSYLYHLRQLEIVLSQCIVCFFRSLSQTKQLVMLLRTFPTLTLADSSPENFKPPTLKTRALIQTCDLSCGRNYFQKMIHPNSTENSASLWFLLFLRQLHDLTLFVPNPSITVWGREACAEYLQLVSHYRSPLEGRVLGWWIGPTGARSKARRSVWSAPACLPRRSDEECMERGEDLLSPQLSNHLPLQRKKNMTLSWMKQNTTKTWPFYQVRLLYIDMSIYSTITECSLCTVDQNSFLRHPLKQMGHHYRYTVQRCQDITYIFNPIIYLMWINTEWDVSWSQKPDLLWRTSLHCNSVQPERRSLSLTSTWLWSIVTDVIVLSELQHSRAVVKTLLGKCNVNSANWEHKELAVISHCIVRASCGLVEWTIFTKALQPHKNVSYFFINCFTIVVESIWHWSSKLSMHKRLKGSWPQLTSGDRWSTPRKGPFRVASWPNLKVSGL